MTKSTHEMAAMRVTRATTLAAFLLGLTACSFFGGAKVHLEHAETSLRRGNSLVAKNEAKKALAKNPHLSKAWVVLARADFLQNNVPAAVIAIEKAQASGTPSAVLAPLKWKALYLEGHYARLRVSLARTRGASALVHDRYEGLALLALHHPEEALKNFDHALTLAPTDVESVVGKALALRLMGRTKSAIALLTGAFKAQPKKARIAVALADVYFSVGSIPQAENAYRRATELTSYQGDVPTWIIAEAGYAQCAIMQAKWHAASEAVSALSRGFPNLLLVKLLRARIALGQGHLPEATANAEAVVAALPKEVQAHMILAYSTYRQGYLEEAETSLDQLLTAHPDYAPARKLLATIELHQGRLHAAERTLKPLVHANAGPNTLILAGEISLAEHNLAGADSQFAKALASKNITDPMRYTIAVEYLKAGEHARAMRILKALPAGSEVAKKRDLLLALLVGTHGTEAQADKALAKVAKRYASDVVLQRTVAQLYASHGNIAAARAQYLSILKHFPTDIDSMIGLASLESAGGNFAYARRLLHKAQALQPKNIAVLMALAQLSAEQGHESQQIKYLQEARKANTEALAPRLALARLYLQKQAKTPSDTAALAKASGPLKEAVVLAPKDLSVILLSAEYKFQSGHSAQAEQFLEDSVTSDPSTTPLLLTLADLQIRAKQRSKAFNTLHRALSSRPGWLPAVRMLCALYTDSDHYQHAIAVARKAETVAGQSPLQAKEQKAGALYIEAEVFATEADRTPDRAQSLFAKAANRFDASYLALPAFNTAVRVFQMRSAAHLANPQGALVAYTNTHPMQIEALNTLSNYYLSRKEPTKAAAVYQHAIADGAANAATYNNLAWLYYVTHNPRALATARKALALAPGQPQIVDTLGWILAHTGKLSAAAHYIAQAHAVDPRSLNIAYHEAWILARTGHVSAARKALRALLAHKAQFTYRSKARALAARLAK